MLLKRWLTAIVLIPVLLFIVFKGSPLVFAVLVAVIAMIGMLEYLKILASHLNQITGYPTPSRMLIPLKVKIVAYLFSPLLILAAYLNSPSMMISLIALNILCMAVVILVEFGSSPSRSTSRSTSSIGTPQSAQKTRSVGNVENVGNVGISGKSVPTGSGSGGHSVLSAVSAEIQGVIYIPLFLAFLVLIRGGDNGSHWILWLWLIIGCSDTGAYYVGTYWGKTPLSPHVSPNKSVEGAIGGLGAAAVAGGIYSIFFISEIPFFAALLFSVVAAAAGQLGDLFESALKRAGRIKDSGTILPGHGGILDRLDGLIFAAPVAYMFKEFIL